jgi:hypothetical protein
MRHVDLLKNWCALPVEGRSMLRPSQERRD